MKPNLQRSPLRLTRMPPRERVPRVLARVVLTMVTLASGTFLLASSSPEASSRPKDGAEQTPVEKDHLASQFANGDALVDGLLELIDSGAVTDLSDVTALLSTGELPRKALQASPSLPLTAADLALEDPGILSADLSPFSAETAAESDEGWGDLLSRAEKTTQVPKNRRRRAPDSSAIAKKIRQGKISNLEDLASLLNHSKRRAQPTSRLVDGGKAETTSPLTGIPTLSLERGILELTETEPGPPPEAETRRGLNRRQQGPSQQSASQQTRNQQTSSQQIRRQQALRRLGNRDLQGSLRNPRLNQLRPGPGAGSGLTPLGARATGPNSLYANLGWTDSSAAATNTGPSAVISQKLLEIVEATTSNRFEIDFNRIQPGTIITNLPITISESGFYYLIHNLTNTTVNADGITIDVDEVTLDLMGYTLYGGVVSGINSDDGIFVSGDHDNITIRNGSVVGWHGDGINALQADFSIFQDLHVARNSGDGLVTDFNCLMSRITAVSNGLDGIEGDDGSVILHSTAQANGDNGIQTSEGCHVALSAAFDNETDGFDIASGSVVRNCSSTDNLVFGFDIALGSSIVDSVAYDNHSNGFDMASACVMQRNIASLNNGHGVRTFNNSWIRNSKFHENDLDGIRISSTDSHVDQNNVTDNDQTGISVTSSGTIITRNVAAGNVTNYNFDSNGSFGPIVDVTGVGDITGSANSNHPWANFEF
ncbi:MAG: right-handed parallel beta-helix repeat-containing protein [Deltaproteobacteria bacterium]|nr:right-handed parallel beta-helix repeat-containing protein [Deltaproteobacteria bacterium]